METVLLVQPSAGMRGPHRTLVAFAEWLSSRACVILAAPRGWVLNEAARRAPAIRTVELPGAWSAERRASARRLASLIRSERPGLIHANGIGALGLVAWSARRARVPVFVHAHDSRLTVREAVGVRAAVASGAELHALGVSRSANAVLRRCALAPFVEGVLPNPIDADVFGVPDAAFGSPVRVGALLSTAPHKGLIRFVHVAAASGPGLEWHAFGLRPHENPVLLSEARAEAARLGVADRIVWGDAVPGPVEGLSKIDVVLVPSDRESFCRVAVEAMAAGRPVVATRIRGLDEIVDDGVNGILFDAGRPDDGAAAIRRLIDDPERRRAISAGGRRTAARFRLDAVGPQLDDVYARIWNVAPVREMAAEVCV